MSSLAGIPIPTPIDPSTLGGGGGGIGFSFLVSQKWTLTGNTYTSDNITGSRPGGGNVVWMVNKIFASGQR